MEAEVKILRRAVIRPRITKLSPTASGKSQKAQVHKFVAYDTFHPLNLKCILAVGQKQTPSELSILKQTFYQVPKSRFTLHVLSPFPAKNDCLSCPQTGGHTAAWWNWGLTSLCSVGARCFPFLVPYHSASISGSGFFLSTSLEASHLLLILTTQSLILPFFLLSPILHG